MTDVAYVEGLERFIIQYLKPCQSVPINLVFRSFNIETPEALSLEEITLEAFIRKSMTKL